METSLLSTWIKKFRILTVALIFSGALNIGLIAAFIFSSWKDHQPHFSIALPAKIEKNQESTMSEILRQMMKLSFCELVPYLTNRDLVEEGYLKRDLAVAVLTSHHHFNLEKALSSTPSQRRIFSLGEDETVEVFPGMSDDQFEAIIRFAYEEKWPLTPVGIYQLLKKLPQPQDESLVQAFLITPEFHALQVLFQKTKVTLDPADLLQLVYEGNWDILDRFAREQEQVLDLSVEKRRRLLLSYLALQSPTAAQLLLKTDFDFVSKRLEDRGAIDLLSLLKEKTEEGERLCLELLRAPRTDAVWQAAVLCLYRFSKEPLPDSFNLKEAMARFVPSSSAKPETVRIKEEPPLTIPTFQQHIVKDKENLWKIARQYGVKIEEIVKLNELEKDRIYPGMTLLIPN